MHKFYHLRLAPTSSLGDLCTCIVGQYAAIQELLILNFFHSVNEYKYDLKYVWYPFTNRKFLSKFYTCNCIPLLSRFIISSVIYMVDAIIDVLLINMDSISYCYNYHFSKFFMIFTELNEYFKVKYNNNVSKRNKYK